MSRAPRGPAAARAARALLLGWAGAASVAAPAAAHWVRPEQVVALLRQPELGACCGVVGVERSEALPRLLLVRVDGRFRALPATRQIELAEQWWHLWRSASPQGVLAIVDAATDASLVSFDPEGRARLRPPPTADPP